MFVDAVIDNANGELLDGFVDSKTAEVPLPEKAVVAAVLDLHWDRIEIFCAGDIAAGDTVHFLA